MRRMQTLTGFGIVLFLLTAPMAWAQDVRPIADFGASGAGVPAFVRDLLPDGFFGKSLTKDIAGGDNHVAALDLSPSSPDLVGMRRAFSMDGLTLVVENTNDDVSTVVISAEYGGGARVVNHVIRLEAGGRQEVDLSALAAGPSLHLVSMLPFSAAVSFDSNQDGGLTTLDVGPLLRRAIGPTHGEGEAPAVKWGTPCGPLQKDIKICAAGTTNCVMARANRDYYPHHIRPQQFRAVAFVSYPIGTAFHCPINDTPFSMTACSAGSYKTKRCDGTPYRHIWNGLDNTFNTCTASTATCTSGCVGSFDVTCY